MSSPRTRLLSALAWLALLAVAGWWLGQHLAFSTDLRRFLLTMGAAQPDKRRVGIAVDHRMPLGFDQLPGAQHDFVAA